MAAKCRNEVYRSQKRSKDPNATPSKKQSTLLTILYSIHYPSASKDRARPNLLDYFLIIRKSLYKKHQAFSYISFLSKAPSTPEANEPETSSTP